MGYYSDPTAAMAVGNINREFNKYEKIAKKHRKLYKEGKLSEKALENARSKFPGIYRHVLDHVFWEQPELWKEEE